MRRPIPSLVPFGASTSPITPAPASDVEDGVTKTHTRKRVMATPSTPLQFMLFICLVVGLFMVATWVRTVQTSSGEEKIPVLDTNTLRANDDTNQQQQLTPPLLPPSSTSRTCTANEMNHQASTFEAAKVRGCPSKDDVFIRMAHLLMPEAKIFVDIGSNKGYTAARFYELWNPQLGLNAPKLHFALKSVAPSNKMLTECGACSDCNEVSGPLVSIVERVCSPEAGKSLDTNMRALPEHVNRLCTRLSSTFLPIRVFSFDGNPEMVRGVAKAIQLLFTELLPGPQPIAGAAAVSKEYLPIKPQARLPQSWTVQQAAFADEYIPGKTISFSTNQGEKGRMVLEGASPTDVRTEAPIEVVPAPVLTVDELVRRENINHIDVLKIDVEGHDAIVLKGARDTLAQGKVTLVIFEYNKIWADDLQLSTVVQELETYGLVCYLEGKNALLKLSSGCWNPKLELRRWSNVFCANTKTGKGVALVAAYDAFSLAFIR